MAQRLHTGPEALIGKHVTPRTHSITLYQLLRYEKREEAVNRSRGGRWENSERFPVRYLVARLTFCELEREINFV